jgi:hypothetical protein
MHVAHERKVRNAQGPSAFHWNTGGWFGGQIGGTAWMLQALFYIRSEPMLAAIAVGCFIGGNIVGLILWSLRGRIAFYPAVQVLLAALGAISVVYFVAYDVFGRLSELDPRFERPYWALLIFPVLMVLFYFKERAAQQRAAAQQPIGR